MRLAGHVARIGKGETYTGFWWGNLRERDHLEDPGADGRIILRWIFRKWDVGAWTSSSWLRTAAGGGHVWMLWWTFGFHKTREISWLAEERLPSEGLCSMEWVSEWVSKKISWLVYVRQRRLWTFYTLVILIIGVIPHLPETVATQLLWVLQWMCVWCLALQRLLLCAWNSRIPTRRMGVLGLQKFL